MSTLSFSTGVKTFEINGHATLSFNPTDTNLYARFVSLYKDIPEMAKQYADSAGKAEDVDEAHTDEERMEAVSGALNETVTLDTEAKARLREVFGLQNDFDTIFNGVNLFALTETGATAIENFMDAILPEIETNVKERQKLIEEKVATAKAIAAKNRAQRRAK